MNKLLLHKSTTADVKRFIDQPKQFLILVGPAGAGKTALALQIGNQLLGTELSFEHPSVLRLSLPPNKSEIPIEQVRELISKLKLTTTGKGDIRRLVIIENGHFLSEEAQNALLKTLEEPPADTQIIMTVDSAGSLLPTITSRGQTLDVRPIELHAAQTHFSDEFSEAEIKKAWLLAEGLVGLTTALLEQIDDHELKTAVEDAKRFILANKYERLIKANDFARNRRQLELLIEGLQKIVKTAQRQTLLSDRRANQSKMVAARKQLEELHEALRANVSPKTIYLKLCLNLGV